MDKEFSLINSLSQADAQWYLKIAEKGYPKNPRYETAKKDINSGLSYAFFPLYPLSLRAVNLAIENVELSAFLFANLMLLINFFSLIYVVKSFKSEDIAIKTSFLLFLFPFSIFFRSYFTEGLFLFLLIWFSYFFLRGGYTISSVFLGLLNVTRGAGVLIYIPFLYFLIKDFRKKEIGIKKLLLSLTISIAPILIWSFIVYLQTGDYLFFVKTQTAWTGGQNFIQVFLGNVEKILNFGSQAFHSFHSSKIDIFLIFSVLIILLSSINKISRKIWLIALCIFLGATILHDTM